MDSNERTTNPFDTEQEVKPVKSSSSGECSEISYHDIATKLLNDNLLLTALELHAELVEAGKELPKLRVFFSNPGNFEQQAFVRPEILSPTIPRSLSQATLDSLDLTRFSEDGERGVDERVAVLEFELRKAKETINALRTNLTVATESETPTPDGSSTKAVGSEPVKPHEQRALNFLINEYLLLYGYKLTSITFADENENQDFEDWDDVGLNISKPIELLQLYRDYMRQAGHTKPPGQDVSCQTDMEDTVEDHTPTAELEFNSSSGNLYDDLKTEVEKLQNKVEELQKEKAQLEERLWACERIPGDGELAEESESVKTKTSSFPAVVDRFHREDEDGDGWTAVTPLDIGDMPQQPVGNEEDQISADIDWASVTMSTPDPVKMPRSGSQSGSGSGSASGGPDIRGPTLEEDDHVSTDNDWTPVNAPLSQTPKQVQMRSSKSSSSSADTLSEAFGRSLSAAFRQEVFARCMLNTSQLPENQQHISDALSSVADLVFDSSDVHIEKLNHILSQGLIRVIPNVILNKREEVIPLLVAAIRLHHDGKDRDALLNLLFNLKKRPDVEERRLILAGLVCVAQGMDAGMVENDVLPQCWEQINHRHLERRLLVAESCGVLAPFVTSAIRNSLMLSMLQQMLSEDHEEAVRIAVVRSAALIAALSPDCDKYAQCEDLVVSCLADVSPNVVQIVNQTLLPIMAEWALASERLQSSLLSRLLAQLKIYLKGKSVESPRSSSSAPPSSSTSSQRAANAILALTAALPQLVLCVSNVEPVLARITPDLPPPLPRAGFSELCRGLSSPAVFHIGKASIGQVIAAFDIALKSDDSIADWPQLKWISDKMLPEIVEALRNVEVAHEELISVFISFFRYLCVGLGPIVVTKQVKLVFVEQLQEIEQAIVEMTGSSQRSTWPSLSVLTVYLAGVLSNGQSEAEMEDLRNTLRRFLLALPLCSVNTAAGASCQGTPLDGLRAGIAALFSSKKDAVHGAVLATLWEGVVSQHAQVRAATAMLFGAVVGAVPETLVSSRVVPALVTLANDPDTSVRTSTIPTFGKLVVTSTTKEVKEKVCFQLQSVLADPATRDSHPLLLQLIATLGQVVPACDASFREDVILPQLAALAAFASQLQNLTRRLDLAVALTEAFSAAVYTPLPSPVLTSAVLPGLRYLEQMSQQLQPVHRETIAAMIREVESRLDVPPVRREERSGSRTIAAATANMNQGVEDMRQRMSKMFQPKVGGAQPSLPSLFRKK